MHYQMFYPGLVSLLIIPLFVAFIISLVAISLLIKAAKEKGYHRSSAGILWLVGIFATPVVLGLYTASLPDRNATKKETSNE